MDILKRIRNKDSRMKLRNGFITDCAAPSAAALEGYLPLTDGKNSPVSLRTAEPLNQEER
jgi:hypothetical protein